LIYPKAKIPFQPSLINNISFDTIKGAIVPPSNLIFHIYSPVLSLNIKSSLFSILCSSFAPTITFPSTTIGEAITLEIASGSSGYISFSQIKSPLS
jgi:hypothetical protein